MPADKMPKRVMKGTAGPLVNSEKLVAQVNPALTELLGPKKARRGLPLGDGQRGLSGSLCRDRTSPYTFILIGIAPTGQVRRRAKGRPAIPLRQPQPRFLRRPAGDPGRHQDRHGGGAGAAGEGIGPTVPVTPAKAGPITRSRLQEGGWERWPTWYLVRPPRIDLREMGPAFAGVTISRRTQPLTAAAARAAPPPPRASCCARCRRPA